MEKKYSIVLPLKKAEVKTHFLLCVSPSIFFYFLKPTFFVVSNGKAILYGWFLW